jgi:hypothetical protein
MSYGRPHRARPQSKAADCKEQSAATTHTRAHHPVPSGTGRKAARGAAPVNALNRIRVPRSGSAAPLGGRPPGGRGLSPDDGPSLRTVHRLAKDFGPAGPKAHFFSGSSFLPLFSGMNGLQGWAFTGPGVFHTTLNWPSAFTSPMNTGLCRWWFLASMVLVKPPGAL